jgi:hypothetical protein
MSDGSPTGDARLGRVVVKAVRPHETHPSERDVQDRGRLAQEVKSALYRVRKTAENWRTGVAGLVTLVTATLLFRGRASIIDYSPWVSYTLGALVLLSLALAIASLWRFLNAAYGRLKPVSAQSILDAGGVDVYNVQLATIALHDLRIARILGLVSAGFLASALLLSWYGPAAGGSASSVKVVLASETVPHSEMSLCGDLKALDADVVVLQLPGEPQPRRLNARQLVSLRIVTQC